MIRVEATDLRRRWIPFRRRRFDISVPENWGEVPPKRRAIWWRWLLRRERLVALQAMARDLVPWQIRRHMTPDDVASIAGLLAWVTVKPECKNFIIPSFRHRGVTYHFPKPKGSNLCCLEYSVADQFYTAFYENKDQDALFQLLATLAREENPDQSEALAAGDVRVALNSSEEARARALRLRAVAPEPLIQALVFFSGLKAYVSEVYGPYLFDGDEEEEEETERDESGTGNPASQPNFGWWGTYQEVAESGVFGRLKEVYQSNFHEVCVFLVRKRLAMQALPSITTQQSEADDDL